MACKVAIQNKRSQHRLIKDRKIAVGQVEGARKGRGHLMTLLETLGRAQLAAGRELAQTRPLERLLEEDGPRLSWGMTLAVITGRADSSISERLKPLARAGVNCVLILAAPIPDIALQALQAQGRRYRFEVWQAVDRSRLFEERP